MRGKYYYKKCIFNIQLVFRVPIDTQQLIIEILFFIKITHFYRLSRGWLGSASDDDDDDCNDDVQNKSVKEINRLETFYLILYSKIYIHNC